MNLQHQQQLMLKIIVGSAWVDGRIEPAEEQYLQSLLKRYQLTHSPEFSALMATPIPLRQTERWMVEYLADSNDIERQNLLGAIGKMVIADDTVTPQEHTLLDDYYALMAEIPAVPEENPTLIKTLGRFMRQVVRKLR